MPLTCGITYLFSIPPPHPRLNLAQNLAHEQNAVDHDPVRRALDLEVAKERVRAEEGENFVERVVGLMVRLNSKVGDISGERGQLNRGTAGACAQGKKSKVT